MPVDHYENFPVASLLLPSHLREPVEAIYAFARSADDVADEDVVPRLLAVSVDDRCLALQHLADEDLRISFIEKREGTGDDYSLYYIYQAETKDNAQAFLKKANIETEGVHIICKTPEGTWGKDVNGIYQE